MCIKEVKVNCFQPECCRVSVMVPQSSDELLIKHLRVTMNMLLVYDHPGGVMMVVSLMNSRAPPSLNTKKYSLKMRFCEVIA